MWKEKLFEERRFCDEDDSEDEKCDDEESIKSAMFPQNDVWEDHDEDRRTEDDRRGVADRQTSESDENASHGQTADQTWNYWLVPIIYTCK